VKTINKLLTNIKIIETIVLGVIMNINCLLFEGFETLDLFGPVEVFGKITECCINYFSMEGGEIKNYDNIKILTENIDKIEKYDVLLIPGGMGTRELVNNEKFIHKLRTIVEKSSWCLTVCTGSALLAKTGLLDNCNATSNKRAFDWVKTNGKKVNWKYKARWVVDEKYYTSSGVSAGIDMCLGFLFDIFGEEKSRTVAKIMEYKWNDNVEDDIYAV
jgi:putative intracellular protease/amidase